MSLWNYLKMPMELAEKQKKKGASALLSPKLYQNKAPKSWLKINSYSSNKGFGYKRWRVSKII